MGELQEFSSRYRESLTLLHDDGRRASHDRSRCEEALEELERAHATERELREGMDAQQESVEDAQRLLIELKSALEE